MSRKTNICDILKAFRVINDLTIKELAQKTGLSVTYITEMEKGKKENPSIQTIDKYSKALNVKKESIMYLLEEFEGEEYNFKEILYRAIEI